MVDIRINSLYLFSKCFFLGELRIIYGAIFTIATVFFTKRIPSLQQAVNELGKRQNKIQHNPITWDEITKSYCESHFV